jgi:hypothetical protein
MKEKSINECNHTRNLVGEDEASLNGRKETGRERGCYGEGRKRVHVTPEGMKNCEVSINGWLPAQVLLRRADSTQHIPLPLHHYQMQAFETRYPSTRP